MLIYEDTMECICIFFTPTIINVLPFLSTARISFIEDKDHLSDREILYHSRGHSLLHGVIHCEVFQLCTRIYAKESAVIQSLQECR